MSSLVIRLMSSAASLSTSLILRQITAHNTGSSQTPALANAHTSMTSDIPSLCHLQYQPVLGSTLKGKDNFKQLIHGFAEVCLTASLVACHHLSTLYEAAAVRVTEQAATLVCLPANPWALLDAAACFFIDFLAVNLLVTHVV